MKKKNGPKLQLNRETLLKLVEVQGSVLGLIASGYSEGCTESFQCTNSCIARCWPGPNTVRCA